LDEPDQRSHDVIVVGAGVIGLACGWRIAEAGASVAVVDRASPGAGASGVAAGMLAPATEADFGGERLLELNLDSARRWPRFAAELAERAGRAVALEPSGALLVAIDPDDARELGRLGRLHDELGLGSERLTRTQARALEPGLAPGIAGALLSPGDAAVEPRALMAALAVALDAAGGELIVGLDAEVAVAGGRVAGIRTEVGELAAGIVVVAAGVESPALAGLPAEARPPVRPVKGQLLRLRRGGAAQLPERIVRTPRCYVVPRASGEVVVGATMEERGDRAVTAGAVRDLLEAAWEVLPDTSELELVDAVAGLRPVTPDNLPLIGPGAVEGLLLATGHGRNGVLLAPTTAVAIAAACAGRPVDPVAAPASPDRFDSAAPLLEAAP
jgi:glycine oxidase